MKAVYPGSFDPITLGHVDIIKRMAPLFSQLHILVADSLEKKYLFTSQERVQMVKGALPEIPNLFAHVAEGLTVDVAQELGAGVILRGIRAVSDFEHEMTLANMNKKLRPDIETLIVFASPEYNFVSSRLVKEVAQLGGDLSEVVPSTVAEALRLKYKSK